MSMHLERGLTTTGKKRGKQKFRNAEAAKRHRELQQQWLDLRKRWKVEDQKRVSKNLSAKAYQPAPINYRGSSLPKITNPVQSWDPCTKNPDKVYTGSAIIGIGTMHKSNAIPIFSDDQAKDISKMRR